MSRMRVFNNSSWIILGSSFNKVSSIVLLYFLTRYLGADGFGKYSFAFFYITLFSCITEMGLTPVLIKHISLERVKPQEIQAKGLGIGLLTTALAISLAWLGTYLLNYPEDLKYLILVASFGLLISFRDVTFRWLLEVPFRVSLQMIYPVILGISSEFIGLLMVLLAIKMEASLESILTVYVLSNLPGFIVLTVMSFRVLKPSLQSYTISAIQILREAVPIGMSNVLMTVYLIFGALILFHFKGEVEVGYYALAFRLTTSLRIIPEAIMQSFLPLLSKAYIKDPLHWKDLFTSALKYVGLIAFPLTLGTIAVAPSVIVLFGAHQFEPAVLALSILIWATFVAFFNTVIRFTFNVTSMHNYSLVFSAFMVVVSVLSAFILIPRHGYVGASYSLVASECAGLFYGLFIVRALGIILPLGYLGKYLFSSLVMALSIWFLDSFSLQIIVGFVIYILVNTLIGGIHKNQVLKRSAIRRFTKI